MAQLQPREKKLLGALALIGVVFASFFGFQYGYQARTRAVAGMRAGKLKLAQLKSAAESATNAGMTRDWTDRYLMAYRDDFQDPDGAETRQTRS
jgi:hypothetical protein